MAHVENIWVYPIKGLDATGIDAAAITEAGTLAGDREYAMTDDDGEALNGKRIDDVHEISSKFDPETDVLTVSVREIGETRQFDLTAERDEASEWFSDFLGEPIEVCRRGPPGFVDRPTLGPSVISTGTLEEVSSWFDGMSPDGARRRLRPNVEIGGVPAFWEDRFLDEDRTGFEIGGVRFEAGEACGRCVIPSRDPDTGEPIEGFRRRFVQRREETLPEWVETGTFEHFYTVMLIAKVPESHRGGTIEVGDDVRKA